MKCGDCKQWGWPGHDGELRPCQAFPCDEEPSNIEPGQLAILCPGYPVGGADLYTRADFGCVLFQPKPPGDVAQK